MAREWLLIGVAVFFLGEWLLPGCSRNAAQQADPSPAAQALDAEQREAPTVDATVHLAAVAMPRPDAAPPGPAPKAAERSLALDWPASPSERQRLGRYLQDCVGVASATLTGQTLSLGKAVDWEISPYLRPGDTNSMQVYPLEFDQRLLRGIRAITGGAMPEGAIRGQYRLAGKALYVEKLRLEERALEGRVRVWPGC